MFNAQIHNIRLNTATGDHRDPGARTEELETRLTTEDLEDLRRSGLSDETILKMNCRSASAAEIHQRTGVRVASDGYSIPYLGRKDQTGEPYIRWRLRNPPIKMRYTSGAGDDPQVYVPPGFPQLPQSQLLVITEGEKKAMKAVQEGIPCLGIQGVWSWPDPVARAAEKQAEESVTEETPPLEEILNIAKQYQQVLVLGDSDLIYQSKTQARQGFKLLTASLIKRGIRAALAFCPLSESRSDDQESGELSIKKQGFDDWLMDQKRSAVVRMLPLIFAAAEGSRENVSEAYLAQEFSRQFGNQLKYSTGRGWMHWNGNHWEEDASNKKTLFVKSFANDIRTMAEAITQISTKLRKTCSQVAENDVGIKNWLRSFEHAAEKFTQAFGSLSKLRGISTTLALAQPYMAVSDDIWDKDPELLGVRNGVVDLRTGLLLPPRPEYLISHCAGTYYDPDARSEMWDRFLKRVQPDERVRQNLQISAGYAATGHTKQQTFDIHYGSGANGKSTFHSFIEASLGTYAGTASNALVNRKSDDREHMYSLAVLVGKRYLRVNETEENMELATAIVKKLCGEDSVTARNLNKPLFTFRPVLKLHLDTNHLPRIRDTTHSMWRRVRVIEWNETISEEEREQNGNDLRQKLTEELPGILTWIVRGAQLYLQQGLPELPPFVERKRQIRDFSDDIQQWLNANVLIDASASTRSSVLYDAFRGWQESRNEELKSTQSFSKALEDKGFKKRKDSSGCIVWSGLVLRDDRMLLPEAEEPGSSAQRHSAESYPQTSVERGTVPNDGRSEGSRNVRRMPGGSYVI
jgi:putative DNA primase/helicase